MKSIFFPAMVILAGFALIFEPLKAKGSCGLNPEIMQPSKCEPPYTVPPNATSGTCVELGDGTCLSVGCSSETWDNAIPGLCGNAVITEGNVPRCESDYAATVVTIQKYTWACVRKSKGCKCSLTATGVTATVTVCNCRDLEPLH